MVIKGTGHTVADVTIGPPSIDQHYIDSLVAERLARDNWSRGQLLSYQRQHLQNALQDAVANSPYYQRSIGPLFARGASLEELPILTKRNLMTNFDQIVTDRRLNLVDVEKHVASDNAGELLFGEYHACATGGTSGERGIIVYDKSGWASIFANLVRFQRMFGMGAESRVLGIGASSPLHISNQLLRNVRPARADFPQLALTSPISEVVEALNAYQPEYLITYPSFLRRLAEEQQAGHLRISPKGFRSIAEALSQDVRALCDEVWGAPIQNGYANTEAGILGGDCQHVAGMHLAEDTVIFEAVDDANHLVPVGSQGTKLLMTTLTNKALPLVRYEVSDRVIISDTPCNCGRPYARITSIDGRREELLQFPTSDGGIITVHASRLSSPLIGTAGIRQFQIQKHSDGLVIRISISDPREKENTQILAERKILAILKTAGAIVGNLSVEVVDNIERVGTGAKEKLVT
jgi:putative adenylate-forming enzyme